MSKFQFMGLEAQSLSEDGEFKFFEVENSLAVDCSGNACGDIDWVFDSETQSYHFFNDGDKRVLLKVTKAALPFGCTAVSRTFRLRPYGEVDSEFYGICRYEANYR